DRADGDRVSRAAADRDGPRTRTCREREVRRRRTRERQAERIRRNAEASRRERDVAEVALGERRRRGVLVDVAALRDTVDRQPDDAAVRMLFVKQVDV